MSDRSFRGPFLLGIDVGTTLTKSVVFDLEGNEVAVSRLPTTVHHPQQTYSEVNMEEIWTSVKDTVRQLIFEVGIDPDGILGIGISSTVGGVWLLDESKRPFRPAILWNDGRAGSILARWEVEGRMQEIFDISGNAVMPGMTLPALRWLIENEPESLDEAKYLMCAKDWIRFKLIGTINSDESDLSQMPCDIRTRTYSDALFELCEVQSKINLFPSVMNSYEVAGTVTDLAAKETGLNPGVPVVIGLADVQAAMVGAGVSQAGRAGSIVGTSSLNNVILDQPSFEPSGVGFEFLMPDNLWIRSLTNTSGTINLDWFLDIFGFEEKQEAESRKIDIYKLLDEIAGGVPVGSSGIIYHPYINLTGVSAPFRNVAARAQFFGLDINHEKKHLLRAVYEGLALSMRELYDSISRDIDDVYIIGGGSNSPFWCQIFADCTGKRMLVPKGSEFGARGVAMLAGVGSGIYKSMEEASQRVLAISRIHQPNKANYKKYSKIYELYRSIYENMQDIWWERRKLLEDLA